MSKVLAVFGATGQQGGSVVDHVLNDTELSKEYKVRIITRDPNSTKAAQLKDKAEVVQGDVNNAQSLRAALKGAHTVFAITNPTFGPTTGTTGPLLDEYEQAKQIADIAVENGVDYLIFSTLPAVRDISDGRYTRVVHFDAKANAEKYIHRLPVKSAFISLGCFMENFINTPFMRPQLASDGTYILSSPNAPQTKLPLLYASGDTGKFVSAILVEPDKFKGKTMCASQALYSWEDIAKALANSSGKKVKYEQVSKAEFASILSMPGFDDVLFDTLKYMEEFGYYGSNTGEKIRWAVENARGDLISFEEFLKKNPL